MNNIDWSLVVQLSEELHNRQPGFPFAGKLFIGTTGRPAWDSMPGIASGIKRVLKRNNL
jgi:hypothetical protein